MDPGFVVGLLARRVDRLDCPRLCHAVAACPDFGPDAGFSPRFDANPVTRD